MTGLAERIVLGDRLAVLARDAIADAFRTGGARPRIKAADDLVTDTDLRVEERLRRAIGEAFPDDGVLGEEGGGTMPSDGAFGWLIDPVDGTVNFARRLGYVCTSIALVRGAEVFAAWIGDPISGEVFHAGPDAPMQVRPDPGPPVLLPGARRVVGIGLSGRHDPALAAALVAALTAEGIEFRRLGAGALCLAHVAAGRLDGYIEPHMNLWDGAGGLHLARAGGAVTLPYPLTGDGGVVFAVAPDLAPRLLDRLPSPFSGPFSGSPRAGTTRLPGGVESSAAP
ncbi:MAG: inositol monophosphatase [Deinococcus-Thermus bacterium]|jgi:myo-inositol-1(or 4)-monophosphatase|nr:inositol monophosphatase [Deinococcota bacterium]